MISSARQMRKFLADITEAVIHRVDVPANPRELFEAMCAAVKELVPISLTLRDSSAVEEIRHRLALQESVSTS